jgi:hypothetical protein
MASLTEDDGTAFFAKFQIKNLDTNEVQVLDDFLDKTRTELMTFTPEDSASGWSVSIPESKQFQSVKRSTFIAYKIFVTNPHAKQVGSRTYSIYRRYSEFDNLFTALKKLEININLKLELPPRKWFGNLSEKIVQERREALEIFLNTILFYVNPAACPPLEDFFCSMNSESDMILTPEETAIAVSHVRFLSLEQGFGHFGMVADQLLQRRQDELVRSHLSGGTIDKVSYEDEL